MHIKFSLLKIIFFCITGLNKIEGILFATGRIGLVIIIDEDINIALLYARYKVEDMGYIL